MINSTFPTLPSATPDFVSLLQSCRAAFAKFKAIFRQFRQQEPTPASTWAFETQLEACGREMLRECVEREYNAIEAAEIQDCPVRLRSCGEDYKRRPKSPNTIGTLFGPIRLDRYRYEALERGERSLFPLEMHLGIEAGLATPALAERIGLQVASLSQQQVLEWLEQHHGIKWSADSLRKLSASLSDGLSSFREAAQVQKIRELLEKAEQSKGPHVPVLVVGRDGVMVPMRHGACREAATATVSVMDRRGKRVGTVYLGQMPEPKQTTLSDQLTSLLVAVLTQWTGCSLRYVYVTDAGSHPQEYFNQVLRRMEDPRRPGKLLGWQWIVDFWHACCYLTKLREALFGDSPAGWKWFKRMRHVLRHRRQGIADVLRSATQHWNGNRDQDAARRKLFQEGYAYLRKYAHRMDYASYRRQGKPIGSGVTEAACKTVFTQRLKQSGMRWQVKGGQVIVALRVLKLSGVWKNAFHLYQQSRSLPECPKAGSYQGCGTIARKIAA